MPIRKIVRIDWIDSTRTCGWQPGDLAPRDLRCFTIGWLIHETDECYTVSTTLDTDGNGMCLFDIPKVAVTLIMEISGGQILGDN